MRRAVGNIDAAAPRYFGQTADDAECVICQTSLTSLHDIRRTVCGHVFCSECIIRWLAENASCPLCNRDLTVEGGEVRLDDAPTEEGNLYSAMDALIQNVIDSTLRLGGNDAARAWPLARPAPGSLFSENHGFAPHTRHRQARYGTRTLSDAVARVTNIMDRARADVIAEVIIIVRTVAELELGMQA